MLINAFPSRIQSNQRVELCRFTESGTFDPADYPTADGLYDVYIVGGGGGQRLRQGVNVSWDSGDMAAGGGGGYAKLLKNIAVTSIVPVTVGAAGIRRRWENTTGLQGWEEGSDGGDTSFGTFGTANGGKRAADDGAGGDGGCGGAGFNCLIGGLNGNDGLGGRYWYDGNGTVKKGVGGKGGGTINYVPVNPYDGLMYGIGGNSELRLYWTDNDTWTGWNSHSIYINFPALNDNPGRGGGATASALPGICIIYGIPKY